MSHGRQGGLGHVEGELALLFGQFFTLMEAVVGDIETSLGNFGPGYVRLFVEADGWVHAEVEQVMGSGAGDIELQRKRWLRIRVDSPERVDGYQIVTAAGEWLPLFLQSPGASGLSSACP
jgi:hypothetical protein